MQWSSWADVSEYECEKGEMRQHQGSKSCGCSFKSSYSAAHLQTMFRPMWHHAYMWLFWPVGPISSPLNPFNFICPLKGNRFIRQWAINEREEAAPDTCDDCVMKEWRRCEGWPLLGWRSGPGVAEGDGKKWGSLYEISLGNPSDARLHYDCGHGIKEGLLLSFLFLLAALKQKIWAVTSSYTPLHTHTHTPLCWGSTADAEQSHSLPCISWPDLWAELAKLWG